jgi:hypothetical protein
MRMVNDIDSIITILFTKYCALGDLFILYFILHQGILIWYSNTNSAGISIGLYVIKYIYVKKVQIPQETVLLFRQYWYTV